MPHPTHKKNHKNRPWSKRGESTPSAEHRTCDLVLGALDEGLLLPEELVEDAAAGAEGLPLRDRVVVPHRAHRRRRRAPPSRGRGAGGEVRRRRWHQRPECGRRHHCAQFLQWIRWVSSSRIASGLARESYIKAARKASVRVERIRIGESTWLNIFPFFFRLVLHVYRIIIFENRRKNTHPCQPVHACEDY